MRRLCQKDLFINFAMSSFHPPSLLFPHGYMSPRLPSTPRAPSTTSTPWASRASIYNAHSTSQGDSCQPHSPHSMCIDAPESTTNSLSSSLITDGAGRHQTSVGENKGRFVFLLKLYDIFGQFPRGFAGTSLLSLRLFLR